MKYAHKSNLSDKRKTKSAFPPFLHLPLLSPFLVCSALNKLKDALELDLDPSYKRKEGGRTEDGGRGGREREREAEEVVDACTCMIGRSANTKTRARTVEPEEKQKQRQQQEEEEGVGGGRGRDWQKPAL